MSVTVIVCTYNRLAYLPGCLAAIDALDLTGQEAELVVVNDGSSDGTRDWLNDWQRRPHTLPVRVIHHEKNQGLSAARNTGIAVARFDILAFTDDDCHVDARWLQELLPAFRDPAVGLAFGETIYIKPGYVGYFPERLVRNPGAHWPMGCNIAYRRAVFTKAGLFDPFFFRYNNEDSEMAIRAVTSDFAFSRRQSAIVYHQAMDWSVASLLRSARNASVWPILKKRYPQHYLTFGPPVTAGWIVNVRDYLYFLTLPIFLPILLLRYLTHGKRDLKIFFAKWPIYLCLRRWYIWNEAIKNRVWMM
jgi:glycosyltransferase involved in cell wall biosynthesis